MAKGQMRGNREVRKPKATKTAPAAPASPFLTKTNLARTAAPPKKKA